MNYQKSVVPAHGVLKVIEDIRADNRDYYTDQNHEQGKQQKELT